MQATIAATSSLLPVGARAAAATGRPVDGRDDDLAFASAGEVAAAIAARRVSSREVVDLTLARIARVNPPLNAIVETFAEEARQDALRADAELAAGRRRGPLHGVPITIKDVFPIAGREATYGYPPLKGVRNTKDSLLVARLRRAGAILIGRTNVPLFANDWQTFNDIYGATNNPWDHTRTPGGSSGGSAASMAAGMGYLSLAGDLGGSIRVPSHFCGVFGHRPSRGAVPTNDFNLHGVPTPEWESAVAGPIARSASDLRLGMQILGGLDAPESAGLTWRLSTPRKNRLKDYRIGYVTDDAFWPLEPELRTVYEKAVDELRRQGVQLKEGWPPGFDLKHNYLTWAYLTVAGASTGTGPGALVRGKRPEGEVTYFEMAQQAETQPFVAYKAQHYERLKIQKLWQAYFNDFDVFLMPPSIVPAFVQDPTARDTNVFRTSSGLRCYGHLNVWPSVSGLSGNPSTICPVGLTAGGLPAGFEVFGPKMEDGTTIHVAELLSEVFGGFRRPSL